MPTNNLVEPQVINNPQPMQPLTSNKENEAILVKNPTDPVGNPQFQVLRQYRHYLLPVVSDPLIKAYFEILATIVLILFFALFAVRPTFNTIAELVKKREELSRTDQILGEKIKNLIAAQTTYSQLESKLPLLDEAMPAVPRVEDLVSKLEQSITDNGMQKTGLTVAKTGLTADTWDKGGTPSHDLIAVPFTVGVTGRFANSSNFISELSNLPRVVDLDGVSLSSSKSDKNILSVTVTGKAFFLP